jgi:metallophosphoesterase (TIGR00282 family)
MRVLAIGDVIGRPGRAALHAHLKTMRAELGLDLVVANGENAAGGVGVTAQTADDMFAAGCDVITLGNHTWKHDREIAPYLDREPRIVRPLNYPAGTPGRGWTVVDVAGERVVVLNLIGRVFMEALDNPFAAADRALAEIARDATGATVVVDMHAEASSEKRAMGHHLDGRVACVWGTHTHIPTADEEVLPGGTGYLSDVGMTGPYDSVIGMVKDKLVQKFLTNRPMPYVVASGRVQLRGVVFTIEGGTCTAVERVRRDHGEAL